MKIQKKIFFVHNCWIDIKGFLIAFDECWEVVCLSLSGSPIYNKNKNLSYVPLCDPVGPLPVNFCCAIVNTLNSV